MAETHTGPVTALELLQISECAPPEIAGRIRRAADVLAGFACPSSGVMRIMAERSRQVRQEGFIDLVDDSYRSEQLARAAACYALPYADERRLDRMTENQPPREWPWPAVAWKPGKTTTEDGDTAMPIDDRIRELEKAGALCAAEIDRLVRLKAEGVEIV